MLPILDDTFYASDDTLSYNILTKYISNYLTLFSNDSALVDNYLPESLNASLWYLVTNESDEVFPIVNITAFQNVFYINSTWADYEFKKDQLSTTISPDGNVVIIYSLIYDNQVNALLNILKTICLCILVTIATVYFESDVKSLVLEPLEVMIEIVDKVAQDPIKAKNLDNLENGMKTQISKMQTDDKNQNNSNSKKDAKKAKVKEEHEVKIIQSAIMKISALLAIGIGEAGNEIIKENLSNYNDLDPMVQGRKKNAIFGFCDIRGFPAVNEALQEETMVFLNQIADIVHSSVDLFHGATNKNIGDAFLMVWKLPNDFQLEPDVKESVDATPHADFNIDLHFKTFSEKSIDKGNLNENNKNPYSNSPLNNNIDNNNDKVYDKLINEINDNNNNNPTNINNKDNNNNLLTNQNLLGLGRNSEDLLTITKSTTTQKKIRRNGIFAEPQLKIPAEVCRAADSAVFGYLKVIAKINRDLRILSYRSHPLISAKIKEFKVNMGFGLHMGWAIEGAIGSSYKIDASYLSPNVNMAARLEAATRQYGVSILISGPLYDLLSADVKNLCRLIDIVTVKGSIKPVKFFTIDLNLKLKKAKTIKKDFTDKARRVKQIIKKKEIKKNAEELGLYSIMMEKRYFKNMLRNARPIDFKLAFKQAFDFYIKGDWNLAANKLRECLKIFEDDGPSKTLLNYILQNNCQAPSTWEGFRALTSK